ncbi:hypothetical protein DER44DRAFT_860127 [Fusarium oxysporum]|nr:hypothetical protein DER44DRAFT_860127 [Fusarium oxysporum]
MGMTMEKKLECTHSSSLVMCPEHQQTIRIGNFFGTIHIGPTAPGRAAFVLYSGREGTARVFASLLEEQASSGTEERQIDQCSPLYILCTVSGVALICASKQMRTVQNLHRRERLEFCADQSEHFAKYQKKVQHECPNCGNTFTRNGNLRTHLIKFDSWARTALLSCSCLCTHALDDQSLEDSGYVNGVFNPIVDKIVNLVDSEMTVVKELTEDHVRVIVAGEFLRPSGPLLPQVEHSG